jgi:hypothetical protein
MCFPCSVILETLHQFKTEVRMSGIVNSGRGVFLTYLGAKVVSHYSYSFAYSHLYFPKHLTLFTHNKLRPGPYARSSRLLSKHLSVEQLLRHPLPAVDHNGKRMTVTITPKSLHLNENNHLWSKKRSSAYDKHSKKTPHHDFDENNVFCDVHQEVQRLRSNIPERERIGYLGVNSIEDYVDDDSISFWNENLMIELGRYGPFR